MEEIMRRRMVMSKKLLNESEVESIYGLNRYTQRRYRARKEIPYLKIVGRVYYDIQALEAWIKSHQIEVRQAK
jgi:hypothetical protein